MFLLIHSSPFVGGQCISYITVKPFVGGQCISYIIVKGDYDAWMICVTCVVPIYKQALA